MIQFPVSPRHLPPSFLRAERGVFGLAGKTLALAHLANESKRAERFPLACSMVWMNPDGSISLRLGERPLVRAVETNPSAHFQRHTPKELIEMEALTWRNFRASLRESFPSKQAGRALGFLRKARDIPKGAWALLAKDLRFLPLGERPEVPQIPFYEHHMSHALARSIWPQICCEIARALHERKNPQEASRMSIFAIEHAGFFNTLDQDEATFLFREAADDLLRFEAPFCALRSFFRTLALLAPQYPLFDPKEALFDSFCQNEKRLSSLFALPESAESAESG